MYGPQKGFAQSQYFDQQATALAGMLANASDINLTDSAFVGEVSASAGLMAGIGVRTLNTEASNRPGVNYDIIVPPLGTEVDADFAGIVVRNQVMRTNSNGEACWFMNDMANYARRGRAGSRIWVRLEAGTAATGGTVYWIVRDTSSHGKLIGAFSAEAIAGVATPTAAFLTGGTIDLSAVTAVSDGEFQIDIDGSTVSASSMDFSSATTLAEVAAIVQTALSTNAVVTVTGNGLTITSTTTGTSSTIAYAEALSAGTGTDASALLGLTAGSGGVLTQGTAGESYDTVALNGARFLGSFTPGSSEANNIALVELL